MDFNDKMTSVAFTGLEIPVSSTKPHFFFQPLANNLRNQLSVWYRNIKGVIMTTINGKLVELNLFNFNDLEDNFKTIYLPEESQELENLQISVQTLDFRVNELEMNTNTLKKLCQKLEAMEKQTSQKILAITIVSVIGFTSLGVWIGVSNKPSVTARNAANYTETNKVSDR